MTGCCCFFSQRRQTQQGVKTNPILSSNINTEDSFSSLPSAYLPLHQNQRTNRQGTVEQTVVKMRGRVVTVYTH